MPMRSLAWIPRKEDAEIPPRAAFHRNQSATSTSPWNEGLGEALLRLEEEVEHAMMEEAAASQEPPLKRCYGGILPPVGRSSLGIKRAIFEGWLRQQQLEADALDSLEKQAKREKAQRRLELNRLTRWVG